MKIRNILKQVWPVRENELERAIADHWPLTAVKVQKILKERGGRRVLLIQSSQGRFVIKIADQAKSQESIGTDTAVLDFLSEHHFIVGISLDGPEDLHSANRHRKDRNIRRRSRRRSRVRCARCRDRSPRSRSGGSRRRSPPR